MQYTDRCNAFFDKIEFSVKTKNTYETHTHTFDVENLSK